MHTLQKLQTIGLFEEYPLKIQIKKENGSITTLSEAWYFEALRKNFLLRRDFNSLRHIAKKLVIAYTCRLHVFFYQTSVCTLEWTVVQAAMCQSDNTTTTKNCRLCGDINHCPAAAPRVIVPFRVLRRIANCRLRLICAPINNLIRPFCPNPSPPWQRDCWGCGSVTQLHHGFIDSEHEVACTAGSVGDVNDPVLCMCWLTHKPSSSRGCMY